MAYHGPLTQAQVPLALAPEFEAVKAFFTQQAKERKQTIVAGTHLAPIGDRIINTALIVSPDQVTIQPKNILTPWESEEWQIHPGAGLAPLGDLGVLVCYDSEFPAAAQSLCESGAKILIIPAYTETVRGFHRVRWSCHARTVECQVFCIHASLVGSLGREPVLTTYGSSAILCPSVEPFPDSGILAESPLNQESMIVAELDLDLIATGRESDDVRNWHDRHKGDWALNPGLILQPSLKKPV
jgi:predicted amidohydrolase